MLDPRAELANSHHHVEEQFGPFRGGGTNIDHHISYATFGGPWNFGPRARKTAQSYEEYRNNNWDVAYDDDEEVQFRPLNSEDDRSGVHSPPLWTTSPPRSPVHSLHHVNINYRTLSPASRTQAIAKGQRELMEMVKSMPESCYELSLKDLVEQPKVEKTQEECLLQEMKKYDQSLAHQRVNIKRQESKKNETRVQNVMRSTSMENGGLFLKMVFPISLKSKKKKNLNNTISSSNSTTISCAKVSPKPEMSDKDWWKKRFSSSESNCDSSGRSSSNNSGSTGSSGTSGSSNNNSHSGSRRRRKESGFFSSCLPCFHFTKGKTTE
ncbi:hypothetical protein M9H77_23805 [Catharanthus roseus]|uniref:Uncharacterized protein n=1 Tax=Catharanthus roseus TaxID=4058 RepID=A0ACC0ATZ5_CATRO|nr:hypothetical protein M9H77_23805 [Catharanthus roseus]